jgi:hypothetical protein
VRSRPASTLRSAPAAFQRPAPITRWCNPSAGVCLTRHHRGFIYIHPSALPQPVIPGWNGSPWASTSGFAPRSCPRRTPRRGQAVHTGLGPTPSTSVEPPWRLPLNSSDLASQVLVATSLDSCARPPRPTTKRAQRSAPSGIDVLRTGTTHDFPDLGRDRKGPG